MLVIKIYNRYYFISTLLVCQQFYKSRSQKAQTMFNHSISSIVNGGTSLEVVTSLYQFEFRGINIALLCQYVFEGDNLILLMKNHMQEMVVCKGENFVL